MKLLATVLLSGILFSYQATAECIDNESLSQQIKRQIEDGQSAMKKSLESFQEDILRRLEVLSQHIEDRSNTNDENIALLREEVTSVTNSLSSDMKVFKSGYEFTEMK